MSNIPVSIRTAAAMNLEKVATGDFGTLGIDNDGKMRVWSQDPFLMGWGESDNPDLSRGNGGLIDEFDFTGLTETFREVYVGTRTACAKDDHPNRGLYCWGENSVGTANPDYSGETIPRSGEQIAQVSNGVSNPKLSDTHACYTYAGPGFGYLDCHGANYAGQLGSQDTTKKRHRNSEMSDVWVDHVVGPGFTCATKRSGAAVQDIECFGETRSGITFGNVLDKPAGLNRIKWVQMDAEESNRLLRESIRHIHEQRRRIDLLFGREYTWTAWSAWTG